MRPRSVKLACFLVLLCAFGAADAATRAARDSCRDCASLRILLMQVASVSNARPAHSPAPPVQPTKLAATTPDAQQVRTWTMRQPEASSAHTQAVTASGL